MERGSVVAVVAALNERDVRYLIVGGLAVVAHGVVRFTADVDLIMDPDEENLRRAVAALETLGYVPRAPVPFEAFVDRRIRAGWARDKNMTVFSLFSDRHRATEIDLFLESPIDFGTAWDRAVRKEVAPGIEALFAGLADLIRMKEGTGRARDRDDIEKLRELNEGTDDRFR